jgi:hypothetical protein
MVTSMEAIGSSELQRLGVLLDGEVLERMRAASPELDIQVSDEFYETTILDAEFGGTFVMIRTVICNVSSRIIWLDKCRIDLPWHDPDFRLLEAQRRRVPGKSIYLSPREPLHRFDYNEVLNHRFGRQGKLNPGDSLDGLILGVGSEAIPYHYQDGQRVDVKLTIWDGRGKLYLNKTRVVMDRSNQLRRQREAIKRACAGNRRKRIPIFDEVAT